MNRKILNLCLNQKIQQRFCSYKPIKRPSLTKQQQTPVKNVTPDLPDLSKQLRTRISAAGAITVADYMKHVLTSPKGGYYMEKDVFGREGDFITSPEIGQIFGELLAIWCLTEWQKVGSPNPVQLIELGPGRGTLSRDILRVFAKFRLGQEFSLHLVEISPVLSKLQAGKLCFQHSEVPADAGQPYYQQGETASGAKVYWYHRLEDVPKEFSIVIAHEFFDALPVHKLQRENDIWREVVVDIDPENHEKFRLVISKNATPICKLFKPVENEQRDCLEYCLEGDAIIEQLAERFEEYGGFGLIVDYGHFGDKTDTFRAFRKHELHDPFVEPGTADLTADVDFKRFKATAERDGKLITYGPVEQRDFIKRMEGDARLKILLENAAPENKKIIEQGYDMLTHPDKMGSRFKFFSMFPSVLKDHLEKFPVAGFVK